MSRTKSINAELINRLQWLIDRKAEGKPAIFAKTTGIPTSTMHEYVSGRVPHADHLIRIHEILGVNLNWLLSGEGDPWLSPVPQPDQGAGVGLIKSIELLSKIYGSNDNVLVRAIESNLTAFSDTVDAKQMSREQATQIRDLKDQCDGMKKRLEEIEKRLSERGCARQSQADDSKRAAGGG